MPRTRQEGVSLPIPKWDWIHENHRKLGFQHKSWFINYCIDYTLKNSERFHNPNNAVKELQKFDEIGNIANERRQKKFSLVKAVDDFEEDVEGLKKLYEKGWITKEQHKEETKRSEEQHKKVVQLELSKKRKIGEELEKPPKFKNKKERLRWFRRKFKEAKEEELSKKREQNLSRVSARWSDFEDGWMCNLGGSSDCRLIFDHLAILEHLEEEHGINPEDAKLEPPYMKKRVMKRYLKALKKKYKLNEKQMQYCIDYAEDNDVTLEKACKEFVESD